LQVEQDGFSSSQSGFAGSAGSFEFFRSRIAGLADPFTPEDLPDGIKEDAYIEHEGPVIDIPDIQPEFIVPTQGVPPIHLRPAGHPWQHMVPSSLFGSVAIQVLHQEWTGTNQAHLSFQHIEELREFIEARGAQEPPQSGDALSVREKVALLVAGLFHRPEFIQLERHPFETRARLPEKDRTPLKHANEQSYHDQDRGENDDPNRGEGHIKQSFRKGNTAWKQFHRLYALDDLSIPAADRWAEQINNDYDDDDNQNKDQCILQNTLTSFVHVQSHSGILLSQSLILT
jgi:hypothetical protein